MRLLLACASGQALTQLPRDVRVAEIGGSGEGFALPRMVAAAARALRAANADVVMSFHPRMHTLMSLASAFQGQRRPLVLCFPGHIGHGRLDWSRRLWWRNASAGVCVAESVREGLLASRMLSCPVMTIPNYVDVADLTQQVGCGADHQWLNDRKSPVLVTVSRVVQSKRIDVVLHAVAALRAEVPARLIVLGDGPELGNLMALSEKLGLSGVVDFCGYVDSPVRLVAKCDVFVFASEREGLPTVLLEAMACRVPIVAVKSLGGVAEVVRDRDTGILVDSADPQVLATAIAALLSDDPLQRRVVDNAESLVRRSYDVEAAAAKYEALFRQVTDGRRCPG